MAATTTINSSSFDMKAFIDDAKTRRNNYPDDIDWASEEAIQHYISSGFNKYSNGFNKYSNGIIDMYQTLLDSSAKYSSKDILVKCTKKFSRISMTDHDTKKRYNKVEWINTYITEEEIKSFIETALYSRPNYKSDMEWASFEALRFYSDISSKPTILYIYQALRDALEIHKVKLNEKTTTTKMMEYAKKVLENRENSSSDEEWVDKEASIYWDTYVEEDNSKTNESRYYNMYNLLMLMIKK
jgi:hypothetical protein